MIWHWERVLRRFFLLLHHHLPQSCGDDEQNNMSRTVRESFNNGKWDILRMPLGNAKRNSNVVLALLATEIQTSTDSLSLFTNPHNFFRSYSIPVPSSAIPFHSSIAQEPQLHLHSFLLCVNRFSFVTSSILFYSFLECYM